jgi:hypothetical protein
VFRFILLVRFIYLHATVERGVPWIRNKYYNMKAWLTSILSTALLLLDKNAHGLRMLPSHAQGGLAHARFFEDPATLLGKERWLQLPVDHFDPEKTDTFQNKYFVEDSFWYGRTIPRDACSR